jgi:hypothetical protein
MMALVLHLLTPNLPSPTSRSQFCLFTERRACIQVPALKNLSSQRELHRSHADTSSLCELGSFSDIGRVRLRPGQMSRVQRSDDNDICRHGMGGMNKIGAVGFEMQQPFDPGES